MKLKHGSYLYTIQPRNGSGLFLKAAAEVCHLAEWKSLNQTGLWSRSWHLDLEMYLWRSVWLVISTPLRSDGRHGWVTEPRAANWSLKAAAEADRADWPALWLVRSRWRTHVSFDRASICEGGLGSRNSVRLSFCLSLCHTRALWQN